MVKTCQYKHSPIFGKGEVRKKIWTLIFWLLSLNLSVQAEISWLKVEEGRIVNEQGETVVLRGPGGGVSPDSEDAFLDQILKSGYNSFRLAINFYSKKSNWEDFDPIFVQIDRLIGKCEQKGIYLILDAHFLPGITPKWHQWEKVEKFFDDPELQKRWKEFWDKASSRYADQPVVAMYELINEPFYFGKDAGKKLKNLFADCVKVIRKNDQRHIIALAQNIASGWAVVEWADYLDAWKDGPLEDPNCCYTLHSYAMSHRVKTDYGIELNPWVFPRDGADFYVAYVKTWSEKWNTCIWVSEFAHGGAAKKPEEFLGRYIDNLNSLGWSAHFWGNPWEYKDSIKKVLEEKLPWRKVKG